MSITQTQSNSSIETLLKHVERLNLADFDKFVARVIALQAKRKLLEGANKEKELLLKIQQSLALNIHNQYTTLLAKREDGTLTPDEHQTLLHLTDKLEELEKKQITHLVELAKLHQTSIELLLAELNLSFYTDMLEAYLDEQNPNGVTTTLNQIYKTEASSIDPELIQLQSTSIGKENW